MDENGIERRKHMSKNEDLAVEIAKVNESAKSAHKRIDEMQDVIKAFYSLAGDVKVLAEQLVNMKEDVNYVKDKVDQKNDEPNKLIFSLKQTIINGIVMIIISATMALIIK
jgi:predicted  nucleic acid-binding Zn-ribbon protein